MQYISYEALKYLGVVKEVKSIPFRNTERKEINYLAKEEIDQLLNACKSSTLDGRRDYLIILLLYNTKIRVSEMISIRKKDINESSNGQCHLRVMGKGRKEPTIPLQKTTTKCLTQYIAEHKILNEGYLLSGQLLSI